MAWSAARRRRVIKLLEGARTRLNRPYGWCQGSLHKWPNRKGSEVLASCLLGALYMAVDDADDAGVGRYTQALHDAIGVLNRDLPGGIVAFNDAPGRRKHEVLALLDRAIAEMSE